MEKVEQIINDYAHRAGNLCGISNIAIIAASGLTAAEVSASLKKLVKQQKIRYREGINHPLFFAI